MTVALGAFVLSCALTLLSRQWLPRIGLVDVANWRSLHQRPTPRGGGVSFALVAPVVWWIAVWERPAANMIIMIACAWAVAMMSMADDRWTLRPLHKLVVQVSAALIFALFGASMIAIPLAPGVRLDAGPLAVPLAVLWLVGLTNAYNFMDGIDGLAAAQAVLTSLTAAVVAHLRGDALTAAAMLILAGAVGGFLVFNWPRASIFMGDVGSAFLGFTLSAWALSAGASPTPSVPLPVWIAVLWLFLFDTSYTLIARAIRREPIAQAHHDHLYQRLVRIGWTHLHVTLLYVVVASILASVAVACFGYQTLPAPLVPITCFMASLLVVGLVLRGERNRQPSVPAHAAAVDR